MSGSRSFSALLSLLVVHRLHGCIKSRPLRLSIQQHDDNHVGLWSEESMFTLTGQFELRLPDGCVSSMPSAKRFLPLWQQQSCELPARDAC